jgi:hypothetical protein
MAVARMCYNTGVSFNVVNNNHFKEMCAPIGAYGPSFNIPKYPHRFYDPNFLAEDGI